MTQTTTTYSNQRVFWFMTAMSLCFIAQYTAYFAMPDDWLRTIYYYAITYESAAIISLLAPTDHVAANGNLIQSWRVSLEIVRGCDGFGLWALVNAAILAFPSTTKKKLKGLLLAAFLVYIANLARITLLYFFAVHSQALFNLMHFYFLPGLLVIGSCAFFVIWAKWQSNTLST